MIRILPHEKVDILSKYKDIIEELELIKYTGKVERVVGLTIESIGPDVQYGELCKIRLDRGEYLFAEVVGFNRNRVVLMPIGDELLGRVISGIGMPLDGKGDIYTAQKYPVTSQPINPLDRTVIDRP